MDFATFVRKPFTVEAVRVTKENIADVASVVGELKHKPDGTPFIQVNRELVRNVYRVYVGSWITKMGPNYRCYAHKAFTDQFIEKTPVVEDILSNVDRLDEEVPQPEVAASG